MVGNRRGGTSDSLGDIPAAGDKGRLALLNCNVSPRAQPGGSRFLEELFLRNASMPGPLPAQKTLLLGNRGQRTRRTQCCKVILRSQTLNKRHLLYFPSLCLTVKHGKTICSLKCKRLILICSN